MCAYFIIDGIITSHTKLTIDIDNDNNLTVSMMRPVLSQKPVTFYSNQKNCIYQTTTRKNKNIEYYFLHIKSNDDKVYTFSKISNIQMIWLLYTISELFGQTPEPLGPTDAVSEIVNQLNDIKSTEPEAV